MVMHKSNRRGQLIFWILTGLLGSSCAGASSHGTCKLALGSSPPSTISSQVNSQNGPAIQILEATYDFGEITTNHALGHVFRIKNKGTEVLEIKKVLPT